jgi:prepilin-type N-terminal cleavage/methylation domain-containing protein
MSDKNFKNKGFTIIEVVLVLAIAGLIFLVVFLALPALQRGQRDSQRKSDLSRMMSQVTAWQSNKQGALPTATEFDGTATTDFKGGYLLNNSQKFEDPQAASGTPYAILQQAALPPVTGPAPTVGQILVYINAVCGGANGVKAGSGARQIASVIFQEQGSYYCLNN